MRKERRSLEKAISGSRQIQIYALVFLLIFMITTAYLISGNIVRSIVDVADVADRKVVEVGAGTGTLTLELAAVARRVVTYEVDTNLASILTETLASASNVDVRFEDAARTDLASALDGHGWVMVANLPYNVGTGIVLDALRTAPTIERIVAMVQREVAERFLAGPGSKVYGLPSVVVGLHASGHQAITVPSQVFEPRPGVDSAVVVLDRVASDPDAERAVEVAAVAFGQRRKMLRRSLASLSDDASGWCERAGIDPTFRPEQLAPSDYVALARVEGSL
jgi:16S rRNA (adenine1518-N6/adenine1519-N6)-dimethyltransferase